MRHGSGFLGVCAGAAGIYFNSYYRKKLKLGNFGQFSTYLPIAVVPTIMALGFHRAVSTLFVIHNLQSSLIIWKLDWWFVYAQVTIRDIFTFNQTKCAACIQAKAAAVQLSIAVVQPLLLAPMSSFMFATRHFTFRMPLPLSQPRDFAKFYYKLSRPIFFSVAVICGLQTLASFIVTHLEITEFHDLQLKMMQSVPADALPPQPKQKNIVETLWT